MTNFTEKIWSVINKNLFINLAPKLTLYHFHRVSKEFKKWKSIFCTVLDRFHFWCCFILIGRSEKNRATFHLLIENCLSAVENLWNSCLLCEISVKDLKVYESGTILFLVPNWQGDFWKWLIQSFSWNSSSQVTLK